MLGFIANIVFWVRTVFPLIVRALPAIFRGISYVFAFVVRLWNKLPRFFSWWGQIFYWAIGFIVANLAAIWGAGVGLVNDIWNAWQQTGQFFDSPTAAGLDLSLTDKARIILSAIADAVSGWARGIWDGSFLQGVLDYLGGWGDVSGWSVGGVLGFLGVLFLLLFNIRIAGGALLGIYLFRLLVMRAGGVLAKFLPRVAGGVGGGAIAGITIGSATATILTAVARLSLVYLLAGLIFDAALSVFLSSHAAASASALDLGAALESVFANWGIVSSNGAAGFRTGSIAAFVNTSAANVLYIFAVREVVQIYAGAWLASFYIRRFTITLNAV